MFKIKTVPKCPKKIRQIFEADQDLRIDVNKKIYIKTKEKTFTISIYPFLQSDHLFDQLEGILKIHTTHMKVFSLKFQLGTEYLND